MTVLSLAPEKVVTLVLWARQIEALLLLPFAEASHDGREFKIRFSSSIEAEEFHKLLLSRRGEEVDKVKNKNRDQERVRLGSLSPVTHDWNAR